MKSLSANEAKTHFGELLLKAQKEPVQISRNGKPVAVVISMDEYDAIDKLKLNLLKLRAAEADNEASLVDGNSFFNELMAGKYINNV
ncbi:MAG: type II toxin-antitoxin system Phd/YefM family antitoxin [Pseudomonadota bacterium]